MKSADDMLDDIGEPDYDYLGLEEPDYDYLGGSQEKLGLDETDDLKKNGCSQPPSSSVVEDYILGTLVIRVVAARDLGIHNYSMHVARSPGGDSTINPYASVKFMGKTQRTQTVFDATDPIWPRSETLYMDVALPADRLSHRSIISVDDGQTEIPMEDVTKIDNKKGKNESGESTLTEPIVTISIFNQTVMQEFSVDKKKKKITIDRGDSNDPFLGTTLLDVTPLLTGKKASFDKWLPLDGAVDGTVRVVCEYESSDSPPRVGDIVSFTRFCKEEDLYPVPIANSFKVKEVNRDDMVLEYKTSEGWNCTFIAHRFMLICDERHQAMLITCQEELLSIQERLKYSPLVKELKSSMERVPDDGLIGIGIGALEGAGSLFGRWFKDGKDIDIETIKGDLNYATNWDGRFNESISLEISDTAALSSTNPQAESPESTQDILQDSTEFDYLDNYDERDVIPGMPDCPITGLPMQDPVVAADGHTYERTAIARWLETSDKSPLTGAIIQKKLVPNYGLISSVQDTTRIIKNSRRQSSITEEVEEDKKMPAVESSN